MNPTSSPSSIDGYELPPLLPPGRRAPIGSDAADTSTHSIRVSRKLWQAFVARANAEGYTPAYAMTLLLYACVLGKAPLPQMTPVWRDGVGGD